MKLGVQIKNYFTLNTQIKRMTTEKDKLNSSIKSEMIRANLDEYEEDGIKATYNSYDKTKLNPTKLLQRLKDLGLDKAIKTIEVPDEAMVETMIYNGELDAVKIEDCIDTTTVVTLTVKEIKAKKGEK